ncbi:MAG: YlxM family DNA-binding protein [Dysosmobacter sp.]
MKNQTYRMTMLFDFYGELLTDRQKEFFDLYYNEDLSLAEIAENAGISRQGVRDVIVRAEGIMQEVEDKTGSSGGSRESGDIWTPSAKPPERSKPSTPAGMRTPGSRSWRSSSARKPPH